MAERAIRVERRAAEGIQGFGERIYRLRTGLGLSMGEVAEIAGVARCMVSKWECGYSLPALECIPPLCTLFGVTADYLIEGLEVHNG